MVTTTKSLSDRCLRQFLARLRQLWPNQGILSSQPCRQGTGYRLWRQHHLTLGSGLISLRWPAPRGQLLGVYTIEPSGPASSKDAAQRPGQLIAQHNICGGRYCRRWCRRLTTPAGLRDQAAPWSHSETQHWKSILSNSRPWPAHHHPLRSKHQDLPTQRSRTHLGLSAHYGPGW